MKVLLTGNELDVKFLYGYFRRYTDIECSTMRHNFKDLVKRLKQILSSDIIHIISIKPSGNEGRIWVLYFFVLKMFGKRVIVHWMGTDVLELGKITGCMLSKLTRHFSYAPWLSEELKSKYITAQHVPIPPPLKEVRALPEEFAVLIYLGHKTRNEFYGYSTIKKLIEQFPSAKFCFVGNVSEIADSPNVTYYGRVDYKEMEDIYRRSTVLLRLTKHDGMPFMVLEALSMGRYVIWNKKFPYCYFAEDYTQIFKFLQKTQHLKSLNLAGAEFVRSKYNEKQHVRKLVQIYKEVLRNEFP